MSKRRTLRRPFERKLYAALRVANGEKRADVGVDMEVAESTLRGWIHDQSIQDHVQIIIAAWAIFNLDPKRRSVEPHEILLDDIFEWYIRYVSFYNFYSTSFFSCSLIDQLFKFVFYNCLALITFHATHTINHIFLTRCFFVSVLQS